MYCPNCGKSVQANTKFCPECGANVSPPSQKTINTNLDNLCLQLSQKENNLGILWLVIGVIQLISGFYFYWPAFILGIYNIIAAITHFKQSKRVLTPYLSLVEDYQKQTTLIIFLIINIIFGALIGVIGIIYDFTIRNFVVLHQSDFKDLINQSLSNNDKIDSNKIQLYKNDSQNLSAFSVTISLKNQKFLIKPKINVNINNKFREIITAEKPHIFQLVPGHYQIEFIYSIRKTIIQFDLTNNTNFDISFNRTTGQINIESPCSFTELLKQ